MTYRVATILTVGRGDSLADTILDGIRQTPEIALRTSEQEGFFEFARTADLILLLYGKKKTNVELAERIRRWDRTVFIDGSEVGKNNRYDPEIQKAVLNGKYPYYGRIDTDMLRKCALYFRREKPYIDGIISLPFGIESSYIRWNEQVKKDIDFCCVFGQDEFPLLRRYVREEVERFCKEYGLTCWTKKTSTPEEFHQILARSKVGISVGGGGFDTMRFWEILGNNCILLTETIDINTHLNYKRIFQFNNLFDFRDRLKEIFQLPIADTVEYEKIMAAHSSKARALTVIEESKKAFVASDENKQLCSVVVSSFDGNEDLWKPFFTLFFRYWPDCPFLVYLISNFKTYPDARVTAIPVGEDRGWANNTKKVLAQISTSYVIFLLEDLFLEKRVNTAYILKLISFLKKHGSATVRLSPSPPPDEFVANDLNVGRIGKEAQYRVSLMAGLWDKKVFSDLILENENPWQMEILGTERSRSVQAPFFSVRKPALHYHERSAIIRGKWTWEGMMAARRENLPISFMKRGVDYKSKLRLLKDRLRKTVKRYLKA